MVGNCSSSRYFISDAVCYVLFWIHINFSIMKCSLIRQSLLSSPFPLSNGNHVLILLLLSLICRLLVLSFQISVEPWLDVFIPDNHTFITRSGGVCPDLGTLSVLGCDPSAFPSNSFAAVLLQSVSKITLMSGCQIPSWGVACLSEHTLSWWHFPVPGICVFPQIWARQLYIATCKNYGINCRLCGCPVSFIYILSFSLMIKYFKITNKFVS